MIRIAEKLAKKVFNRMQRHSCLILRGGRIVTQANNIQGHAEQVAINRAKFNDSKLKGCTLISFRFKPGGTVGNAKPCIKCQFEIEKAGIRKVIYFDGDRWKEEFL